MNDPITHFAPGDATGYVSRHALVLAAIDDPAMSANIAALVEGGAGVDAVLAATATLNDVAVVQFVGSAVHAAARGAAAVDVVADGRESIEGSGEPEIRWIEHVREARLRVRSPASERRYSVCSGVVPAALLERTGVIDDHEHDLAAAPSAPEMADDPFDTIFGCTVARSVEAAAVRGGDVPRPAPGTGVERPPMGVLLFSTGERILVDRPLLLGRNPRVDHESHAEAPRLVKLPGRGVSRRHAAITIDGWRAHIDDLGSSNGTEVTLPGLMPRRLAPGHPVGLVAGTHVDLGGDVSFVVEDVA